MLFRFFKTTSIIQKNSATPKQINKKGEFNIIISDKMRTSCCRFLYFISAMPFSQLGCDKRLFFIDKQYNHPESPPFRCYITFIIKFDDAKNGEYEQVSAENLYEVFSICIQIRLIIIIRHLCKLPIKTCDSRKPMKQCGIHQNDCNIFATAQTCFDFSIQRRLYNKIKLYRNKSTI